MKTHISVDTKIKVGLIGFVRMGRFYLKEMQKSGRWEVAYICDINPDCRELAKKLSPESRYWKTNSKCSMMKVCR